MIETLIVATLLLLGLQFVFTLAYKIISFSLVTEFKNDLELCYYNEKSGCNPEYENKIKKFKIQ